MKTKIIAIMGKSGVGKDSARTWIVNNIPNTHRIVTCTTRPPREGEKHGVDYNFYNDNDFNWMFINNLVLEAASFRGWLYWTGSTSIKLDKINIGVYNLQGIENLINDETLDVMPILLTASDKTRLMRSLNREKNPDVKEIIRRYNSDEKDFMRFSSVMNGYPCISVSNDDVSTEDLFSNLFSALPIKNFMRGQEWVKKDT